MEKKFLKQIELGERSKNFQYLNAFSEKYTATWYKWAKIVIRTEGEEIDEEETQATIKLLRAAPDLLEALEEAKEVIGKLKRSMLVHPDCTEDSEFDDYADLAQETEANIEAVIKKALS